MGIELAASAEAQLGRQPNRRRSAAWAAVAVLEVALCIAAVLYVTIPTLVILPLIGLSLAVRRDHLTSLGFHRTARPWRLAGQVAGLTVGWTILQLVLIMPVLNHVTGQRQDLSDFHDLQGNGSQLLVLLVLSWTIAAFGEETIYRGFLPTRITDVLGPTLLSVAVAVAVSSVMFGLAHTEQGLIGVAVTFLDALFFSALRLHYRNLFAPVLAHGFNNTLGLVAYFLVGPIYGFW